MPGSPAGSDPLLRDPQCPFWAQDCRSYQGWEPRCELLEGSRRPGHTQQVGQGSGWVPSPPAASLEKGNNCLSIPHASGKGTELTSLMCHPSVVPAALEHSPFFVSCKASCSLLPPAPMGSCSIPPLHKLFALTAHLCLFFTPPPGSHFFLSASSILPI